MMKIYLDYAAATPVDPEVLRAMQPYFSEKFYNPSALYLDARATAKDVQDARAKIAKQLGVRPSEIIFTAGGTESDNLAIRGVMEQFPNANLVISAIEHEAVLKPAHLYNYKEAPVNSDGVVDLKVLEKLIDSKTVLVSIMYANNEIGTIQPLREIAQIIKSKIESRKLAKSALPLFFHTDACQATNYLHVQANKLGVDMMTVSASKIYGPKQMGGLYLNARVKLSPQILGGGQEHGMRSGTENVAGIVGFATALDIVQNNRLKEVARMHRLQELSLDLIRQKIPAATINGSSKHRLPNNIHITIPGQDNERLIMLLDEKGIQCAAGSACSASNEEPSHVLSALGLTDKAAQSSLRLTMGRDTDERSIRYAIEELALAVYTTFDSPKIVHSQSELSRAKTVLSEGEVAVATSREEKPFVADRIRSGDGGVSGKSSKEL